MSDTVLVALIGAGATVLAAIVAAIAAVIAKRPGELKNDSSPKAEPITPTSSVTLTGRYTGERGDSWDFSAVLEVLGSRLKGRVHWTLVDCPPALPWAGKVGGCGYEFVEGSWDEESMSLRGFKVSDAVLLSPAEYTLVFGPNRRSFEGTSRPTSSAEYKKWGGGMIRGTVAPSA